MNMEERRLDVAKTKAIEDELSREDLATLCRMAAFALVRVLDGEAWWDIIENTGMQEEEARRIRALANVLSGRR